MVAVPGQSAYNAAKFAVRGYSEAIAQEARMAGLPITVHCVHPGGIVTNIARSAHVRGDWGDLQEGFDRIARTTPERCAQVILRGVVRGRARIFVGLDARVIHLVQQTLGVLGLGLIRRISARLVRRSSLPGAGGRTLSAIAAAGPDGDEERDLRQS
jgi:NAD(P)-dependent dehydrogenase (short-subunit alcohol dehydrogenase family)